METEASRAHRFGSLREPPPIQLADLGMRGRQDEAAEGESVEAEPQSTPH